MNNKLYAFLLAMMTICLISGCGSNNVTEKQLREDIIEREEIQNCYNSKFVEKTEYQIKEYNLIKEQYNKDKKEDIIFGEFILCNNYFDVKVETKILYNYYDKGGWIMDELSVEVVEIIPVGAPDVDAVVDYINEVVLWEGTSDNVTGYYENGEYVYVTGGELSGVNSTFDASNVRSYISVNYVSPILEIDGFFTMQFVQNDWEIVKRYSEYDDSIILTINDVIIDYSSAVGEFKWDKMDFMGAGELIVHNITGDSIIYSLNFENGLSEIWYNIEEGYNLTAEFNPYEGVFTVGESYTYLGASISEDKRIAIVATLRYDVLDDEWISDWTMKNAVRK